VRFDRDAYWVVFKQQNVLAREKQIGGSGVTPGPPELLLDPPGPLLTHLHTVDEDLYAPPYRL
jgi:hypothetical protein